ncbi:MAG: D-glycero-beta-D-manno-heptose 1-phosphate adenylyltransferase [candidate division NC10 bacterium]|nr:D-glycero-beta-D-manno-heptose 1-phosphate adenylyltransferase [candidate division NC10 bacterium]
MRAGRREPRVVSREPRDGSREPSTEHPRRARDKVKSLAAVVRAVRKAQAASRRVVFTNGCFDLLHRGHTRYLEQARALGDLLVVAINGDTSVRTLKGRGRPVVPAEERAEVLAALAVVDLVLIFDDLTPARVIHAVRPDVLVKGGDWPISQIVGADFVQSRGGIARSLPYVDGASTTELIRRVLARRAPRD